MDAITIVISYQAGTSLIMEVCLKAIQQFTKVEHKIVMLTKKMPFGEELEAFRLAHPYDNVDVHVVDISGAPDVSSKVHGMMLDSYLPDSIDTEYVMTLDSDCFPVAEGWLKDLRAMLKGNVRIAGILHPWGPPPPHMPKTKIEWRVRSQHCWETTHVACQLLKTDDLKHLKSLGAGYNGGDDTGLLIPKIARQQGWEIKGYKVSRCPQVADGLDVMADPEFNRYVCLVFGDKVYHHGGFSRVESFGDEPLFENSFGWAKERVLKEGAAWLLDDKWSYRFKFDKEDEVAAEKMQRLFGMHVQRMSG